jgi:S-formylglutathione hydrolase
VTAAAFTVKSEQRAFGGTQGFYEHESAACAGPMRFGVYLPPRALAGESVPVVYYLAGLTCTEETFVIKGGAQRAAAELGLALVTPDTSPRSVRIPGDDEAWDFGRGAGFYVDATEAPWSSAYKMYTYVTRELVDLVEGAEGGFPIIPGARGILGHSMGGHGALTIALREGKRYRSASAFAPIVAPTQVPWGQKALPRYLGNRPEAWSEHDAVALVSTHGKRFDGMLLIDQGDGDQFLERELKPDLFEAACRAAGQPLTLRIQPGYDHSYYFISTFVEDHLRHHARALAAAS